MNSEQRYFLLLLLLVVVPCIMLSYFSLQALLGQKNLVEQKIKESYTALAFSIHKRVLDRVKTKENLVASTLRKEVWIGQEPFIPNLSAALSDPFFKAIYVIDHEYNVVYPKERPRSVAPASSVFVENNYNLFENAHFYEFQKLDFASAIREYQKIVVEEKDQKLESVGYALLAIARCHRKNNQPDKALETYQYLATLFKDRTDATGIVFVLNAKQQTAELYQQQKDSTGYYQTSLDILDLLVYSEHRLDQFQYSYYWGKIIESLSRLEQDRTLTEDDRLRLTKSKEKSLREREQIIAVEAAVATVRRSLIPQLKMVAEKRKDQHGYVEYQIGSQQYLAYYRTMEGADRGIYHFVYTIDLTYCIDDILIPILQSQGGSKDVLFRVTGRDGRSLVGDPPSQVFLAVSQSLSPVFPSWEVAVYLKNIRSLDELSRYRSQIYMTGFAVIIIILVTGIYISVAAFIRQAATARLQSDFLSNVSHEFKTPLTSIKMFVETLMMGRTRNKEEELEYLQIIAAESDRLRRLLERILNFAKMEQHKRILRFAPEDMCSLIQETVDHFKKQIRDKQESVEIIVSCEQDVPKVPVDKEAMVEAVMNLLSNGYKYNTKPQKKLEVGCKKIGGNVAIVVKDNGIGIPKHEQHRIFQKFYRVEDPEVRHIEGTGLGLSLVDSIVKAHKGKIKIQSKHKVGSEFTILLDPTKIESYKANQPPMPAASPSAEAKS